MRFRLRREEESGGTRTRLARCVLPPATAKGQPVAGIAPGIAVGHAFSMSSSSTDYGFDEGCDGMLLRSTLPWYYTLDLESNPGGAGPTMSYSA